MFNLQEKIKEYQSNPSHKRQQLIEEYQTVMKSQISLLTSEVNDPKVLSSLFQFFSEQAYFFQTLSLFESLEKNGRISLSKSYHLINLKTTFPIAEQSYYLGDFFSITELDGYCQLELKQGFQNTPLAAFVALENQHQLSKLTNGHLDTYQFELCALSKTKAPTPLIEFYEDGQFHLKPYFSTQSINDGLKQKLYQCIRDFLYHQENLINEQHIFDEINQEDFKVELINILSESKYQIFREPLLEFCESDVSNHECLKSCLNYLDDFVSKTTDKDQTYLVSCLKKLLTCIGFMQHPIIEDAIEHLLLNSVISNITPTQASDSYTYDIQTLGPISLTFWFQTKACFKEQQPTIQTLPKTQSSNFVNHTQFTLLLLSDIFTQTALDTPSDKSMNPRLIFGIYDYALLISNQLNQVSIRSNHSSFESIDILPLNPNQLFIDGLKNIQKLLTTEINRLTKAYAKAQNPHKHRWSITGVTRDKLSLVTTYQGISNDISTILVNLDQPNPLNIDESLAKAFAIKTRLYECLTLPANTKNGLFYNCESRIESRENLKDILRSFNKVLPEQDTFSLTFTTTMPT